MIYDQISFTELKQNKQNVYCFGAGKAFDAFMKEFANFHLEHNIRAVVDNHAGTMEISYKEVNGTRVPIISVEQMLGEIKESDRLLVTTAAFAEIVQQLSQISILDSVKYGISYIMRGDWYDSQRLQVPIPARLSTYDDCIIPKTIHYCWFGEQEIPDRYKKYIESWKRYCPDYEIIEWNESNYDIHKNTYMSQAYDMKKWAFVSDYARVDIIHEYGGVYMDTDVELIKNIDEMLKNEAFCGFESSQYISYALGFGAKKNHPIIKEIKDYYESRPFVLEDGQMDQTTCPVIQTEIMKRHGLVCNGEFQVIDGMPVYPERILCGMSPFSFRVEKKPVYTYAIHHFEGSWNNRDEHWKENLSFYFKKERHSEDYFYPE